MPGRNKTGSVLVEKSVYDLPSKEDGTRILVMRIWPRGVKKERVDIWMKDLGTEKDLIKEWKAGKLDLGEFRKRYLSGLDNSERRALIEQIAGIAKGGRNVTLLCSDKDPERCHRSFLKELVDKSLK